MPDHNKIPELDSRVHAYLDGELSSSESAAFEEDLRSGIVPGNPLKTLMHLGAWFRATRPRTPSSLVRSVENALAHENAERLTPSTSHGWKPRGFQRWLRWALVPATALAAVAVVLSIIPQDRVNDPSDGVPTPSEHATLTPTDPANVLPEDISNAAETKVRYSFSVEAKEAREVCLAGDFNDWKVCEAKLTHVGEDVWSITIDLPPGRHEYMFVIDGQWITDPRAMGYTNDGFGNQNAVVVV